MKYVTGQRLSTGMIVHELRLMVDRNGKITDRRAAIIMQAADRLEELDERVAIMTEGNGLITWENKPETSIETESLNPD